MNRKKLTLYTLTAAFLLCVFFYINRLSEQLRIAFFDGNPLQPTFGLAIKAVIRHPFVLSLDTIDLAVAASAVLILVITLLQRRKVFRPGEEYGSARWGKAADIAPFIDPDPEQNIILTETERLSMAGRMKRTKTEDYNRNKNVLVIGGTGSGKSLFFVLPNLLQMHSSYVITDPKGTLLRECGNAFEKCGYQIRVLNLNETEGLRQSQSYNPFVYINSEADILKLVDVLMANTNGDNKSSSADPFWQSAERLLYTALIGYIWSCGEPEDKNILTLLMLINSFEVRENDDEYQCAVDLLFRDLEAECPEHFAVSQYRKFKLAAGKTAKSILISCGARLAPFDIKEVRDIMSEDDLELDKLGDRKTALFVITSDTSKTFNFIAAIMYAQMFNLLCDRALYKYGGRLPVHVRCILDEFANIGRIPNFEKLISVIRSREISACPILQSKSQLKELYKDEVDTIVDNCDTMLFLSGTGFQTLDEVVKLIGKQTIDQYHINQQRGRQSSNSINYQKLGRELITVDELATMSRSQCICRISGVRPFKSRKYNTFQHPRFYLTSHADRSNEFTPLWLRPPVPISPEEPFEILNI